MGSVITYEGYFGRHTIPLGRHAKRESAMDICLMRAVAVDCPLLVKILIRTNGGIDLWDVSWHVGADNTYWHFADLNDETRAVTITPQQRDALERMCFKKVKLPGDLTSGLGRPVCALIFAGTSPDEVAARRGWTRPVLNGPDGRG